MQHKSSDFFVAVWVLTYGHERFVQRAMESVLEQKTNFPIKIYVCDDASKDKTVERIQSIAVDPPHEMHVFANTVNLGPTQNAYDNYSRCFQSGARYIAMLEGDDYWDDPTKLQQQVDYLENHPQTVLVWHDYDFVSPTDEPITEYQLKGSLRDYSQEELKKITSIKTLTVCYRNVLHQMPDEYLRCPNGDTFLFSILGEHGGATFLPSIKPAKYRIHQGGLWSETKSRSRDLLTLKSYRSLADYYARAHDQTTVAYYLDRYIKTSYLLCYEDRMKGEILSAWRMGRQAIGLLIGFKRFKILPHVCTKFAKIILLKKEIQWALRKPDISPKES